MSHWYTLKMEKTDDKNAVKAAYMALLPNYNPEDNPEGFANLRAAYETALKEIDQDGKTKTENDPVSLFFAELNELYQNFARRIDPLEWEEALKSDVCTALDTEEEVDVKILEFIAKNHNLPTCVFVTLNSRFRWTDRADELCKRYGPKLINSIINCVNSEFNLFYGLFDYDPGADVDRFIFLRNALTTAIDNRNKDEADKLIDEIKNLNVRHPVYDIELARYLSLSEKPEEALSTINAVIAKHPEFTTEPFALYVKATVLLGFSYKCKLDEALNTYNKAIEIVPNYYFAQLGVVDVYVKQKEYDSASKYLTDVMMLENPSNQYLYSYYNHISTLKKEKYEALYAEDPTQETAIKLAKCYSQTNEHDKCIELLTGIVVPVENHPDGADLKRNGFIEKTAESCDLLGYSYSQKKEYDLAIKFTQESIEKEPKYKGYFLLSGIYLAKRLYDKVIENADKALNANLPEEGTDILGKARLLSDKAFAYKKLGRYAQALEVINEAMAINDKMSDIYADKAEILTYMNKLSDAYAEAEKAMNLTPNWSRPYELMADIFYRAGNFDQMAEVFKKTDEMEMKSHGLTYFKGCRAGAIKEYDECNEILSKLLDEENLGTWEDKALDALCHYNRQSKNHENVVMFAERLIVFLMKNEFTPVAYAYTYLATAHKNLRNQDKQYETLKQGLEAIPNNESLMTELGYYYEDIKSPEEALNIWQQLTEIVPKSAVPYNRIAMQLNKKDKYQEALDILNQGLSQIPGNLNLLGRRAYVYEDMKEYKKAIEDCLQVAENPQNQYTWWTKGSMYFELGWIYWTRLNNAEAGIKYFLLAEEHKGFTNNWKKGLLGSIHEWHKDYEKALAVYNECIANDPKDESSIFDRGYVYKQTGKTDKAKEDFMKVIEMVEGAEDASHDLYRLAGSAYLEMDNHDNARVYFEKCEETIKTDGTKNGTCACVHSSWAKYYKYVGDYAKALTQIEQAIGLANSVRNNELKQEIEALV